MRVEWTDELSIGIGIIDDQHMKLVERVNAFVDAVECRDDRKIEETVNYLIGYTIQHFGAEELIMLRNGYDDFKKHREEHNWFIKMVYDVNKELLDKGLSQERLDQVRELLVSWIVNHIKVSDKRIGEVIR
ncbi:hemerythrin family protein [Heliomicrobium modesticaldum Ice1]|uniref:Hemerythrin family protein n=1 Tax=Heliobacterium modesticaldum (strain ATCC 51547 / Ice1) TaxID=498761 RepID=B0TFT0_HELMI|nr:bacteriohemerythrin [Heliomicrobium modesticaldum]ABZ84510.1 hemerythrin family protein [Heliomicrobium modesticaldum Ice1]